MPPMALLGKTMKGAARARGRPGGAGGEAGAHDAQMLALAEADYLARLAAETKKQLRERMAKEQLFTQINRAKVEAAWLKIMRLAKVDQLRRDIDVLSQSHEREVDRKDAMLQMLDRDLDEAEEQFSSAVRSHLLSVDRLIEVQDERLNDLERTFERDLAELEEEFARERAALEEDHKEEVHRARMLSREISEQQQQEAQKLRQEHEARREELRTASAERIEDLSRVMDDRIMDLESELERAHVNYLRTTDTNTERFKEMGKKFKSDKEKVAENDAKILRLQEQLDSYRAKMAASARDFAARNASLVQEKAAMARHVADLKRRMNASRGTAHDRLQALSGSVRDCKADVAKATKVAETVLQLQERARGFLSTGEKINPFYEATVEEPTAGASAKGYERVVDNPNLHAQHKLRRQGAAAAGGGAAAALALQATQHAADQEAVADGVEGGGKEAADAEASGEGAAAAAAEVAGVAGELAPLLREAMEGGEVEALENFMKAFNKVTLDQLALEDEKKQLAASNAELRSMLAEYLEGTTITPGALDGDNPLLVVNNRSAVAQDLPVAVARRRGQPSTVEAAEVARTTRLQARGRR